MCVRRHRSDPAAIENDSMHRYACLYAADLLLPSFPVPRSSTNPERPRRCPRQRCKEPTSKYLPSPKVPKKTSPPQRKPLTAITVRRPFPTLVLFLKTSEPIRTNLKTSRPNQAAPARGPPQETLEKFPAGAESRQELRRAAPRSGHRGVGEAHAELAAAVRVKCLGGEGVRANGC